MKGIQAMNENINKKVEMFLKELAELTDKYGLAVNGCGCCGSPWIYDVKSGEVIVDNIDYNEHEKKYEY
jgi:hypothetical protein